MKMKRDIIRYGLAFGLFLAFLFPSPQAVGAEEQRAGARYTVDCMGEINNLVVWSSGLVEVYLSGTGDNPAVIAEGSRSASNMLDVLLTAHLHHKQVRLVIGADERLKCRSLGEDNAILSVQTVDW